MLQIRCLQELKRLQPVGRGFQVVIAEKCHISAPGINKMPIILSSRRTDILMKVKRWKKCFYALLLSFTLALSTFNVSGIFLSTVNAAEKSTLDEIKELLAHIDSLNEDDYTPESWEALMQVRESIVDPDQFPENLQTTTHIYSSTLEKYNLKRFQQLTLNQITPI